jgi:hypothetical protein
MTSFCVSAATQARSVCGVGQAFWKEFVPAAKTTIDKANSWVYGVGSIFDI